MTHYFQHDIYLSDFCLYKIAEVWKWIEKMKRVKPEVCLCVIYLLYLLFTDIYYDMFSIELCERYKELHYV